MTVGGDNTLRKFDIRDLTKSDILHDRDNDNDPFVRVSCNKQNSNQIAIISLSISNILIYDMRNTFGQLQELSYHSGRVNNIAWCPTNYSGILIRKLSLFNWSKL